MIVNIPNLKVNISTINYLIDQIEICENQIQKLDKTRTLLKSYCDRSSEDGTESFEEIDNDSADFSRQKEKFTNQLVSVLNNINYIS